MKLKAIHHTLDRWFSRYIRRRDTIKGYGKCCSCGRFITFENSDCGHFISRDRIATRWDHRNAHAQCQNCNRFRSGEQHKHGMHIREIYGQEVVDELLWKSKFPKRYLDHEIKSLTEHYKKMVKEMEK